MIIKKEKGNEITVIIDDAAAHARKITYSTKTNRNGQYLYKKETDLNFYMETPPQNGKTLAQVMLENKIKNDGYEEITRAEYEKQFEYR